MTPLLKKIATAAMLAALTPALAWSQGPRANGVAESGDGGAALATTTVGSTTAGVSYLADGQIEAVRETTITSQVAGQVLVRTVRAGDRVRKGQVLVRIDPRAAQQNQAAVAAQLEAARAQLVAADKHLERTRQLVAQRFLSPATLDRAEADQRAAAQNVTALTAQTAGAATQTGWHTLAAPFDAVVTSTSTEVGDTALPGKPLLQLHDPSALRIALQVPAAVAARIDPAGTASIDIPDADTGARNPAAAGIVVVSAADPVTHTQLVRIELARGLAGLHPGLFARVRLPLTGEVGPQAARLTVPASAVVKRGDLRAVYVVEARGVALRQVRVGRTHADRIEVLAGLATGEKIALDPVAAARVAGTVAP